MLTGKWMAYRSQCSADYSARYNTGFTYLGLLMLVAIIGLLASAGLKLGAVLQRAASEQALLDIGTQFSDALKSYAAATPRGQSPQPPTLQALLKDPRFPTVRRHLRQIFIDPMTGSTHWGVKYLANDVGVIAVYSLSEKKPIKVANFDEPFQSFNGKTTYREWQFGTVQARTAIAGASADQIPARVWTSPLDLLDPEQAAPVETVPQESVNPTARRLVSPLDLR